MKINRADWEPIFVECEWSKCKLDLKWVEILKFLFEDCFSLCCFPYSVPISRSKFANTFLLYSFRIETEFKETKKKTYVDIVFHSYPNEECLSKQRDSKINQQQTKYSKNPFKEQLQHLRNLNVAQDPFECWFRQ